MVPDIGGGRYDIFRVYGMEERDGRLFWPSLKSDTSNAAITGFRFYGMRRKESPIAETSTIQMDQQKEHIYRSAINMADELLQQVQELFEGQIDFEGQKQTELISTVLLAVSGLVAFVLGFTLQNIYVTLWTGLGGAALAFLVVVPPYPFYNKSPERWLPSGSGIAGSGIEIDGKKIN